MQNTLRAVSQPLGLNDGLNSTIRSAVNSRMVRAMMRVISIRLLTVAIAPEKSMSAKVRSIAIRPDRDSPTIGTKIVMSTRKTRKKLRCRSSRQKPGNRLSATSLSPLAFVEPTAYQTVSHLHSCAARLFPQFCQLHFTFLVCCRNPRIDCFGAEVKCNLARVRSNKRGTPAPGIRAVPYGESRFESTSEMSTFTARGRTVKIRRKGKRNLSGFQLHFWARAKNSSIVITAFGIDYAFGIAGGYFNARRTAALSVGRSSITVRQTISGSAQPVSCPPNLMPRHIGANDRRLIAEPHGGFADHQQFPFHGGAGLGVALNASKSIPWVKSSIMSIASEISRRERRGSLKGNDCLALGSGPHWLFQHPAVGQIDASPENISEAHFQTGHVEKGEALSAVKIAHQIDIRLRQSFTTGHRTEQERRTMPEAFSSCSCARKASMICSRFMSPRCRQAGYGPNCIISKRRVVAQCLELVRRINR